MRNFWQDIFTDSLVVRAGVAATVVGMILEIFAIPGTVAWPWKLVMVTMTVLLFLVLLFYYRAREFYNSYSRRIPVIRQVANEQDPESTIIVIKNPGYIREGCLLTLRSATSGASQALAILEVTNGCSDEPIQAIPFPRGTRIRDIGRMIEGLYATPIVHLREVRDIVRNIDLPSEAALRQAVGNSDVLAETKRWLEIFESE